LFFGSFLQVVHESAQLSMRFVLTCVLAFVVALFACAQVVHDFEHGGLTNDFLVNSLDLLAVRYNDRSPLENHHLAAAFTLMRKPEYDFICNVPNPEFDKMRKVGVPRIIVSPHSVQCQHGGTPV
jgi:hypothetical protein